MTPADFIVDFPAFESVKVQRIQYYLDLSLPYFEISQWTTPSPPASSPDALLRMGQGLWVAHHLLLELDETAKKNATALKANVTSETAGGVTTTWSSELRKMEANDPLTMTTFGKRYRQLSYLVVGTGAMAV